MKKLFLKVKCPRCFYVWKYQGKHYLAKKGVISCAFCKTTMELSLAIERAEGCPVSRSYEYKIPLKAHIREQIKKNKAKIRKMEKEKNE